MRSILPVTLAYALTGAAWAQPAQPVRMPINIVDCDTHTAGRTPLAVVGTLFTGGHCYREYDADRVALTAPDMMVRPCPCIANKYSHAMTEYLLGNVRPRPSAKDEDTCVFLTSPPLSNGVDGGVGIGGFDFTVDALVRQDATYSLTVTYWHDDSKHQWGPGPLRKAQMVRLSSPGYGPGGWLKPGDYSLRILMRDMFMPVAPGARPLYQLRSVREGRTGFSVVNGEPWDVHAWEQEPSTSVIREPDLQAVAPASPGTASSAWTDDADCVRHPPSDNAAAKETASWPRFQQPFFAVRVMTAVDGAFPPFVFVNTKPGGWKNHNVLTAGLWEAVGSREQRDLAAESGTLLAHIGGDDHKLSVGPNEYVEVSAIEWTADEAVTIHVRTWASSGTSDRKDGAAGRRELLVPLEVRGLAGTLDEIAKRLKVSVELHRESGQ